VSEDMSAPIYKRDVEILKNVLDGLTYEQAGAKENICGSRVAQICSKLLRQMSHPSIRGEHDIGIFRGHIKETRDNKNIILSRLDKLIEHRKMTS
jgi:hypothetical protein